MNFLRHIGWRRLFGVCAVGILVTLGRAYFNADLTAAGPVPPGVTTPTSLVFTINRVDMQQAINRSYRFNLLSTPTSLDVVKNTGLPTNAFDTGGLVPLTYNGIRFVFNGTGTFSGVDPCTGNIASDAKISLPDVVNNELIEQLQVPHPVTGLQSGATGQIDAIHVGSDPVDLKLIVPTSNSVGCISDSPPARSFIGNNTGLSSPFAVFVDPTLDQIFVSNNSSKTNSVVIFNRNDNGDAIPLRTLQGADTGISNPAGIFVDSANSELMVANSGNDSISFYDLADSTWDAATSDIAPINVISGPDTGISGPGGIFELKSTDEIYVANGPDDSITVYQRPTSHNSTPLDLIPKRIIKGPTTGLSTPCGIYVDDSEIAVVNNGNSSITFYNQNDDSTLKDVTPLRTIKGDKTGISNACNIVMTSNEVAVASAGENSINFFDRTAGTSGNENIYPKRQIRGVNAALGQPVGLSLDTVNSELAVANIGTNSVNIYKEYDVPGCTADTPDVFCSWPHLLHHPVFINPKVQQQLLINYIYHGQIQRSTGQPLAPYDTTTGDQYVNDPITGDPLTNVDSFGNRLPIPLPQGYGYTFKVYDPTMHSAGDVNTAYLIPPSDSPFKLADGTTAANLVLGCASFTPFTTDVLSTNCNSQPLVISPFPPKPVLFHIAAVVVGKTQNKRFVPNIAPLSKSELPLAVPQVTMGPTGAILSVTWSYVDDSGQTLDLPSEGKEPLLSTQSFSLAYNKPYNTISSCYVKRTTPTLAFSSGGLTSDIRTVSDVKDSGCDIFMKDVASITFSAADAYQNSYSFTWEVVDK